MFVLIRPMLVVTRRCAGKAFAGWQFSESTYPTSICEILFARNFIDATAIEWRAR
jgi:hypothetical protein